MFATERHREILMQLKKSGQVSVAELSAMFQVTAETVRSDLKKLEKKQLLVRTHGGAVPVANKKYELNSSFYTRVQNQVAEKKAIAKMAASMIKPKDRLFMDASSTALFLARELITFNDSLTIITQSVRIVAELADNSHLRIICTGGELRSSSFSLVGPSSVDCVNRFHADIFFSSCTGLAHEIGATESDEFEVEVKQAMAAHSDRTILMLDHTKFDKVGLSRLWGLDEVDLILTNTWDDELLLQYPKIHVPQP